MTNSLLIYCMVKYFHISSFIRKQLLIYDFAPDPIWIYLCMRKFFFSFFISVTTHMFTYWIYGGSDEWKYIFIVVPKDGLHPETQLFILRSNWIWEIENHVSLINETKGLYTLHTVKTLYRKFETNIPRNETARPRSNFHIPVSVSDLLNIFPRSVHSHIHKCGNWERGRAVLFLGIHKSDLLCSAAFMRIKDYSPHDIIEGVQ